MHICTYVQSLTYNFRGILNPRLNLSELHNTSEEKEETGVLSACSKLQLNGLHVILQKTMPPPTSGTSVFFKKPSVTPQD